MKMRKIPFKRIFFLEESTDENIQSINTINSKNDKNCCYFSTRDDSNRSQHKTKNDKSHIGAHQGDDAQRNAAV